MPRATTLCYSLPPAAIDRNCPFCNTNITKANVGEGTVAVSFIDVMLKITKNLAV